MKYMKLLSNQNITNKNREIVAEERLIETYKFMKELLEKQEVLNAKFINKK